MAKIIHSMIRVIDLDRSIHFYREAFGLTPSHQLDFEDFALVYLRNDENDMEIELTLNKGTSEPSTREPANPIPMAAATGKSPFALTTSKLSISACRRST